MNITELNLMENLGVCPNIRKSNFLNVINCMRKETTFHFHRGENLKLQISHTAI